MALLPIAISREKRIIVRGRTIMTKNAYLDKDKPIVRNMVFLAKELRGAFSLYSEGHLSAELSHAECRVIGYICRHPGVLSVDIARDFHFVKSTVSSMVKSLEEKGYVLCRVSETDKRKTHLYPSEKAISSEKELERLFDEFDSLMEKGLSEEEKEILFHLLEKIDQNIKEVESK